MEDAASPKGEQVRKAGAALAAALLTLPLAASTADATVSRALPLEELVGASETVVRGRVIFSQAITNPGGSIVTLSEIEVEDVLAGDAPATITVVEPGGEPGDTGVGMTVSGAARFEAGEEVVVFARPTKGAYEEKFPGTFRPVGMSQGKLRVVRESGTARVLRDLSGIARVTASPDGGWAPVRGDELSGLTLDELVQRVTSATAASPR